MISKRDERELWARARPFLGAGRPGDIEHTLAVVEYGKTLTANEGGDPLVVIPALILHDVGWSRVDYLDLATAPAKGKTGVESVRLHMLYGARIASKILTELGFDQESIEPIVSIISVHDIPEAIRELDDLNSTLVFEADWLDKFSPARIKRYTDAFKDVKGAQTEGLREYLETYKTEWFRTRTSRDILEALSRSSD